MQLSVSTMLANETYLFTCESIMKDPESRLSIIMSILESSYFPQDIKLMTKDKFDDYTALCLEAINIAKDINIRATN